MIDVKTNYPSKYGGAIGCRLCHVQIEDQKHLTKCEKLLEKVEIPTNVQYEDVFKGLDKQKAIVRVFKDLLREREILLNLEVSTSDGGPDAQVHQDLQGNSAAAVSIVNTSSN